MLILALETGWNQNEEYQNNEAPQRKDVRSGQHHNGRGSDTETTMVGKGSVKTASSSQDHVQVSRVGDIPPNDVSRNHSTPAMEIRISLGRASKKIIMEILY